MRTFYMRTSLQRGDYTTNIYLFKVNTRHTRKRCEICLKFTIKYDAFHNFSSVSIVDFEQADVSWVIPFKNDTRF